MTNEQEQKLILATEEGLKNAYTKNYNKDSRVGASVLTDKGNIYSSGNYTSDTGSLTLHGEQAVLAHSASHGEYGIVAIAIAGNERALSKNHNQTIYPCHMCKQLVWESCLKSGINTEILLVQNGKVVERMFIKDIMNYAWPNG